MFLPREGFSHINQCAAGTATFNARISAVYTHTFIAADKITRFWNGGAVLHSEIRAGCLIPFKEIIDVNFENTSELKQARF